MPSVHRLQVVVFTLAALALGATAIYFHSLASLTLPVPWGDEAYFVWQARAFERTNSFIAPELDPSRPILLLPFVYAWALGMTFKVLGYSLEVARHFSLSMVLAGYACLVYLVRRQTHSLLALGTVGLFLLSGFVITMGNVARMEAMLFAAVCGALLSIDLRRHWTALALLSVTPMIHPNGIFYLFPAAVYVIWARGAWREPLTRTARGLFAVSAVAWVANGSYALVYWQGLMHDTAYRLSQTSTAHQGIAQFVGWSAVELTLIGAVALLGVWRRSDVGHLLVFALAAWFASHVRLEQWYEPFRDFAYLLTMLALIEITAHFSVSTRLPASRQRMMRFAASCAVGLALLTVQYASGRLAGPIDYLEDLRVSDMRLSTSGVPYFSNGDARVIRDALSKTATLTCPTSVEVYPWGDALLLDDLGGRVRFYVPYFDILFQPYEKWVWGYGPTPAAIPDLYLIRTSRYQPAWLVERGDIFLSRALEQSGVKDPTVVHSRNGTEVWYSIRPETKVRTAAASGC